MRHFKRFRYKDRSGRELTTFDFMSKEIIPKYGQRREVACSSLRGISKQYIG